MCHVGYQADHGLVVVPTLYGRDGDFLYLHGSPAAGMFRKVDKTADVCVTVTLVDELVLARSLFNHSINYRSVVVFGRAEPVEDEGEIFRGLQAITENTVPGRWDEARHPNPDELRQTLVVKLSLDEASAKVRTGPPGDDPEDLALEIWAGVIPVKTVFGEPVAVADLPGGLPLPVIVAMPSASSMPLRRRHFAVVVAPERRVREEVLPSPVKSRRIRHFLNRRASKRPGRRQTSRHIPDGAGLDICRYALIVNLERQNVRYLCVLVGRLADAVTQQN